MPIRSKETQLGPHFYRRVRFFIRNWYVVFGGVVATMALPLYIFWPQTSGVFESASYKLPYRPHLDHSVFYQNRELKSPQDVTRSCLECHQRAADGLAHSAHWTWLSAKAKDPVSNEIIPVGKRNLINNFCIGTVGNEIGCTKCHAGYGWVDSTFDFNNHENMDCLVCHENSGVYAKGPGGLPDKSVNLVQVAKSVGYPKRENCGSCHFNGGGGMGVKHGDLDGSLINASAQVDVHMGKLNFLCIDCHKSDNHQISGKINSTEFSSATVGRVSCTQCHNSIPHKDERLNLHLTSVACQTCHIPTFANRIPTKMDWDWSKAGDATRKDDLHTYLKIKGEFKYESEVTPEYQWFNQTMHRYLLGEKIATLGSTKINRPLGAIEEPESKIWPFKVHRGKQPFDKKENTLLVPMTAGKGGYWTSFNWEQALRLGAEAAHQKYSGNFGFTATEMYWPINHLVVPKSEALKCNACHNSSGEPQRLDWKALGYDGDPVLNGGRQRKLRTKNSSLEVGK